MLIGHEIVSFPIYVWVNYSKFINEKELTALGNLWAIQSNGKKSWEEVAFRMGYKSIAPLETMINKMAERGIITRESYSINANPFYQACFEMWERDEVEASKPKEKKVKVDKPEYAIARGILKEFKSLGFNHVASQVKLYLNEGVNEQDTFNIFLWSHRYVNSISGNDFALRIALKTFIGANIPEDDFTLFLAYLASYQNRNNPDVRVKPFLNQVTVENYNKWVSGGSKIEFVDKKKKKIDISAL